MMGGAVDIGRVLARIESVNVGLPRPVHAAPGVGLPGAGAAAPPDYLTAITKTPVRGPVAVGLGNLAGDRQADTKNHGGLDKAVHAHFARHLAWWGAARGWPVSPGEIGENLTLTAAEGREADEAVFCIGDVVTAGTAILQVTQPRIPCFKQAAALHVADAVRLAGTSGRTGLYLRVLETGSLQAGDVLTLVARPNPAVTVADANRYVHRPGQDRALWAQLAASSGLGVDLRRRLRADAADGVGDREAGRMPPAPAVLDARPFQERHQEPFADIMQAVEALLPGQGLLLINTFDPRPLEAVMSARGFGFETRELGPDQWEVLFTPRGSRDSSDPPAPRQPGRRAGPGRHPDLADAAPGAGPPRPDCPV